MSLATDLQMLSAFRSHFETLGSLKDIQKFDKRLKSSPDKESYRKLMLLLVLLPKQVCDLAEKVYLTRNIVSASTGFAAGYAAGKLVDTNKDASSSKTAITAVGAVASAHVVSSFAPSIVLNRDASEYDLPPDGSTEKAKEVISAEFKDKLTNGKLRLAALLDELKISEFKVMEFMRLYGKLSTDEKREYFYVDADDTDDAEKTRREALRGLITEPQVDLLISTLNSAHAHLRRILLTWLSVELGAGAIGAYHGYQRSGLASALGFFLLGTTGLGLGLAQGFAKPVE